ncbi:hypothetical protein DL95DRAFT_510504 [Leptodontidium sp. 2 PMI_412]|nr:hypothetical protein DL95DRAFT_510504 [Leptodontidium sp. 2 PMI_412]
MGHYFSALEKETNIVSEAAHLEAAAELYDSLWDQRTTIQALVKDHLRLNNQDTCTIYTKDQWIRGSFNVCIPIEIRSARCHKKFMFRCPMPHKLAEAKYPGTVDEKLSSEVGTYAWMQHQCPDIRIPHLYGFGFSNHRHFVHEQQRPLYIRLWHRNDPSRRQKLFQGMARLMLSLTKTPQPRIGSFQFNLDGTVTLTNRPIPCSLIILENNGALRTIKMNETYTCTEPFVADMLALHENSFLSNPNANITCLIDLEWLTGHGIDEIVDNLCEFNEVRQEFMKIFEEEEANMASKQKHTLASIMHEGWESRGVWFWRCLTSTNGMISLVGDHICPMFSLSPLTTKVEGILSEYWCRGSAEVVQ